jgi:rieske iron-sulfur protein
MSRIGRRALLQAGISAGLGLSFSPGPAMGQDDAATVRPREGDLLIKVGDSINRPLTLKDIRLGAAPIMAWAMDPKTRTVRGGSRLNQLLLVRLDAKQLSPDTTSRAANGVVAYTAICTHTGCEVDDWLGDEQVLHCSCHGSKFDPRNSAKVVEGVAPRPLPALPLKLEGGRLRVAGPFTTRVGFESA